MKNKNNTVLVHVLPFAERKYNKSLTVLIVNINFARLHYNLLSAAKLKSWTLLSETILKLDQMVHFCKTPQGGRIIFTKLQSAA